MKNETHQLTIIAEQHREAFDTSFFDYIDYVEESLINCTLPQQQVFRGAGDSKKYSLLVDNILYELHLLFCTNDLKYSKIRLEGASFSKIVLPSIAGYIAGTLGISVGVATGAVAFLSLLVFRIGISALCKTYSDSYATSQMKGNK